MENKKLIDGLTLEDWIEIVDSLAELEDEE